MAKEAKGSGLAVLFGGLGPKAKGKSMDEEPVEESMGSEATEPSADYDAAFETAASEAFEALKNDDAEAFKSALKSAVQSCMDEG